jgi:hypothetical protein
VEEKKNVEYGSLVVVLAFAGLFMTVAGWSLVWYVPNDVWDKGNWPGVWHTIQGICGILTGGAGIMALIFFPFALWEWTIAKFREKAFESIPFASPVEVES